MEHPTHAPDASAATDRTDARPHYHAVFVSDVHLGTRDCQAERLRRFLKSVDTTHLYVVGDLVDLWAMRRSWYWPQPHNDVIQTILKKARHGTRVVYIPGNHDEHFREFVNLDFGGIAIRREIIHDTADGRRLLVVHGDEFDTLMKLGWLYHLGDFAYSILLLLNRWMNRVRRWFGMGYWSLAAAIKRKVKNAMQYVGQFEVCLARKAREVGADGVVCGHIHKPDMRVIDGIHYYNDGDWVDSCTALVEHLDGRMEILLIGRGDPREDATPLPPEPPVAVDAVTFVARP